MIDFKNIRGETVEGQRTFFEQLVCHLANLDNTRAGEFRRIQGAGGDGGVEALRILRTNKKIGYQAKFYTSSKDIDWKNLDESVKTALTQHPELERYVIALPCDFTGRRAAREGSSTEGVWGKWDTQVAHWETLAIASHMKVDFEPWTAFEIEAALLRPTAEHLIRFFFDRLTFTREWMRRHLNRTFADLQARYSPDEHVDTEGLKPFDVVYHRENVRIHLKSIFEVARRSTPRAGAALIENVVVPEPIIKNAEAAQKDFMVLEDAINRSALEPWPVCQWVITWHSFTRRLNDLVELLWQKPDSEAKDDRDALNNEMSETIRPSKLITPEVFGGRWMYLLPIDGARAALFIGSAGAGKSHVLARNSETAWNDGIPIIHLLGQHFLDDDPRISILKRLGLTNWSFHDALVALDLAAEAKNTRALLVIDALNEGRGTEIWRNHLGTLIREVNEHKHIVLVVSCREEYLQYVIPQEIIAQPKPYPAEETRQPEDCAPLAKLVPVHINGFQTTQEREAALKKFMDEKGIARPTAPVLDPEFFNPLFMSSVCRSMAKAGLKIFPQGLHGAREIFGFVLETKAKALGTRHDGTDRVYRAMLAALDGLAASMVENRKDKVPLHYAIKIIQEAFEALPISGQTWLDILEGSDIVRRDVEPAVNEIHEWSKPNEVIRFSFQRLQDNLIAERLISESHAIDIEDSFAPNGPFAFMVRRSTENGVPVLRFSSQWIGTLGAVWAAVAETYGKELFDLRSFFGDPNYHFYTTEFQQVFHTSVRERKGMAFTDRTKEILDFLWKDEQEQKLTILLSNCCVPGHLWNADFLTDRLLSLSASERDSAWSTRFGNSGSKLIDRAALVINWALGVDVISAEPEVMRLVGLTLACLLLVKNPNIRDQATKAFEKLVTGVPDLGPTLQTRFEKADDWPLPKL